MSKLKDEIVNDPTGAGYAGMTNEAAADWLNAKTIASKKAIQTADIQKYLMLTGLLLAIESATTDAAKTAARALQVFESFHMNEQMVAAKFTAILDGLVADNSIPFDVTHRAIILSMADTTISRAEKLGLGIVTNGQVQAERN